jgi:hypothetical protein
MEQYLIDDYGVIESEQYLQRVEDIEPYFENCSEGMFDCGRGYYQDEIYRFVKIGDKFYNVRITAVIYNHKQDRGAELYYVNSIADVTYNEIDKPLPILKKLINLEVAISDSRLAELKEWLDTHGVEYSNFA